MRFDDPEIQAYIDGQLGPDGRARVESALERDGLLARRVRKAMALEQDLRDTFKEINSRPHSIIVTPRSRHRHAKWPAPLQAAAVAAFVAVTAGALGWELRGWLDGRDATVQAGIERQRSFLNHVLTAVETPPTAIQETSGGAWVQEALGDRGQAPMVDLSHLGFMLVEETRVGISGSNEMLLARFENEEGGELALAWSARIASGIDGIDFRQFQDWSAAYWESGPVSVAIFGRNVAGFQDVASEIEAILSRTQFRTPVPELPPTMETTPSSVTEGTPPPG